MYTENCKLSSNMKVKKNMKISQLAAIHGVSPATIRFYEASGMFSPGQVTRSSNGYREYSDAASKRLQLVLRGHAAGFSLKFMREHMKDWDSPTLSKQEKITVLNAQLDELESQIKHLEASRQMIEQRLSKLL